MRCAVGIFFPCAFCHSFLHIVLVAQVEGNRPVDLLQAQCREVRPNGLRRLALLKLPHDEVKRHTARCQIESTVSALDELPIHGHAHFQFTPGCSRCGAARRQAVTYAQPTCNRGFMRIVQRLRNHDVPQRFGGTILGQVRRGQAAIHARRVRL